MNKAVVAFGIIVCLLLSMAIGFATGYLWGSHANVIYSVDKAELTTVYVNLLRTYYNYSVTQERIEGKADISNKIPLVTFTTLIYFMEANAIRKCSYTEADSLGWVIWVQKGVILYYWQVGNEN